MALNRYDQPGELDLSFKLYEPLAWQPNMKFWATILAQQNQQGKTTVNKWSPLQIAKPKYLPEWKDFVDTMYGKEIELRNKVSETYKNGNFAEAKELQNQLIEQIFLSSQPGGWRYDTEIDYNKAIKHRADYDKSQEDATAQYRDKHYTRPAAKPPTINDDGTWGGQDFIGITDVEYVNIQQLAKDEFTDNSFFKPFGYENIRFDEEEGKWYSKDGLEVVSLGRVVGAIKSYLKGQDRTRDQISLEADLIIPKFEADLILENKVDEINGTAIEDLSYYEKTVLLRDNPNYKEFNIGGKSVIVDYTSIEDTLKEKFIEQQLTMFNELDPRSKQQYLVMEGQTNIKVDGYFEDDSQKAKARWIKGMESKSYKQLKENMLMNQYAETPIQGAVYTNTTTSLSFVPEYISKDEFEKQNMQSETVGATVKAGDPHQDNVENFKKEVVDMEFTGFDDAGNIMVEHNLTVEQIVSNKALKKQEQLIKYVMLHGQAPGLPVGDEKIVNQYATGVTDVQYPNSKRNQQLIEKMKGKVPITRDQAIEILAKDYNQVWNPLIKGETPSAYKVQSVVGSIIGSGESRGVIEKDDPYFRSILMTGFAEGAISTMTPTNDRERKEVVDYFNGYIKKLQDPGNMEVEFVSEAVRKKDGAPLEDAAGISTYLFGSGGNLVARTFTSAVTGEFLSYAKFEQNIMGGAKLTSKNVAINGVATNLTSAIPYGATVITATDAKGDRHLAFVGSNENVKRSNQAFFNRLHFASKFAGSVGNWVTLENVDYTIGSQSAYANQSQKQSNDPNVIPVAKSINNSITKLKQQEFEKWKNDYIAVAEQNGRQLSEKELKTLEKIQEEVNTTTNYLTRNDGNRNYAVHYAGYYASGEKSEKNLRIQFLFYPTNEEGKLTEEIFKQGPMFSINGFNGENATQITGDTLAETKLGELHYWNLENVKTNWITRMDAANPETPQSQYNKDRNQINVIIEGQ